MAGFVKKYSTPKISQDLNLGNKCMRLALDVITLNRNYYTITSPLLC